MTGLHIRFLRAWVAALAAGAVVVQAVVLPQVASSSAARYPEVAHLERPYLVASVAAVGAVEVALLAAWRLLSAAETGGGLTGRARRWADVLAAALCGAVLLLAGVCAHAGFVEQVGGPPMALGLIASPVLVLGAVVLRRAAVDLLRDGRGDRLAGGPRARTVPPTSP